MISSRTSSAISRREVMTPSIRSNDENMPMHRDQSMLSRKQSTHTHRPGSAKSSLSRRSSPAATISAEVSAANVKRKGTLRNRLAELRTTGAQCIADGMVEDGLASWGRALKLHANNFGKLKSTLPPLWMATEEYILIANKTAVERDVDAAPSSSIVPLYQCIIFLLSDDVGNSNETTDNDELFTFNTTSINRNSIANNKMDSIGRSRRLWDRRDKISYFAHNVELKQAWRSLVLNNIAVHEHITNPANTLNTLAFLMKSLLYSNGVFCTLTLYNLAVVFVSCGRFDDAAEAVARCLELAQLYLTSLLTRLPTISTTTNNNNSDNNNNNITHKHHSIIPSNSVSPITLPPLPLPASSSSSNAVTQRRKSNLLRDESEMKSNMRNNSLANGNTSINANKSKYVVASSLSLHSANTNKDDTNTEISKYKVKVNEEIADVNRLSCVREVFIRFIASHVIHCHLLLATLACWSNVPELVQQQCQLAMICAEQHHLAPSDPLYQTCYQRLRQAVMARHCQVYATHIINNTNNNNNSISSSSSTSNESVYASEAERFEGVLDKDTPPKLPLIPFGALLPLNSSIGMEKSTPIRLSELLGECKNIKTPRELKLYIQATHRYMRETEEAIRVRVQEPSVNESASLAAESRQRGSLRSLLQTELFNPVPSGQSSRTVTPTMESQSLISMEQEREDELEREKEQLEERFKGDTPVHDDKLDTRSETSSNVSLITKQIENPPVTIVTRIPDPALHRYKQLKHTTLRYVRQSNLLPPLPHAERCRTLCVTRNAAEILNLAYLQSPPQSTSPRPSASLSVINATYPPVTLSQPTYAPVADLSASHFMRHMNSSLKHFSRLILDPLPAMQLQAVCILQRAWRCFTARQERLRWASAIQEWLNKCDAAVAVWECYANWRACKRDICLKQERQATCMALQDAIPISAFIRARVAIETVGQRELSELVYTYERVVKEETETCAAILIQSCWRRWLVQFHLRQEYNAARCVQCQWRRLLAARELRRRRVHKQLLYQSWLEHHYFHIIDIQRWWRACNARINVNGLLASKQCAIQRYLSSCESAYNHTLGSLLYESQVEQKGRLIMGAFHGARDRAKLRVSYQAHRIICRAIRHWVLRYKGQALLAFMRQRRQEQHEQQKRNEEVCEAALRLQGWFRVNEARRASALQRSALLHLHNMAARIQRCYRVYRNQKALSQLAARARLVRELDEWRVLRERSACVIQSTWRMHYVRREWGSYMHFMLHERHGYATRVQRIWRGYYARQVIVPEQVELMRHVTRRREELSHKLTALITVQSFCKMCIQRCRFVKEHPCLKCNTSCRVNNKNKEKCYEAERCYNEYNGYNAQDRVNNIKSFVQRIQRCWRRYAAKTKLHQLRCTRAYHDCQRASEEALHGYATVIQSTVRAKLLNPLLLAQQRRSTSHRPRLSDENQMMALEEEEEEQQQQQQMSAHHDNNNISINNSDNNNNINNNNNSSSSMNSVDSHHEGEMKDQDVQNNTRINNEEGVNMVVERARRESYPDLITDEIETRPANEPVQTRK